MDIENTLSEAHKDALQRFARMGDRREPLAFVGRQDILQDIDIQLQETRAAKRTLSNARIIQGPPGAGKTSILSELDRRYADTGSVVPIRLFGEELRNPVAVGTAFIESCGFDANVLGTSHSKAVTGRMGLRWVGAEGSYGSQSTTPQDRIERGAPVLRLLDDYIHLPTDTTLLVLVDETQRIRADRDDDVNTVAAALVDGNTGKLKTFTVFGGLSDTGARLTSAGVSPRITQGARHRLGALEESAARELIAVLLEHDRFGLRQLPARNKEILTNAIISASECYPRHMYAYMQSLALEFSSDQARIGLQQMMDIGHGLRIDYYDDLLSFAGVERFAGAISRLLRTKRIDEGMTYDELEDIALIQFGMSPEQIEASYDRAIHCGILEVDTALPMPERHLRFPIPSLRSYAATGFDRTQTLALMRGVLQGAIADNA